MPRGSKAQIAVLCFQRNPMVPILVVRLFTNTRSLALQLDSNATEKALSFPKLLLELKNGSFANKRLQNPATVYHTPKKYLIREICDAVFSKLQNNY